MCRMCLLPVVWASLLLSEPVWAAASNGGVSLSQTRVIFSSSDQAQVLKVKNTDSRAYLIQSRVQPSSGHGTGAPFIVTPPLFSLKPDSQQLLRIVSLGGDLPADRESLFYLEVLAIPTLANKEPSSAQVSMGLRFVLKMFYRPEGLSTQAPTGCHLKATAQAGGVRLENPTPYYQTLGRLALNNAEVNLRAQPSMLAPMSEQRYPFARAVTQAKWQTITDYGELSALCQQMTKPIQEKP